MRRFARIARVSTSRGFMKYAVFALLAALAAPAFAHEDGPEAFGRATDARKATRTVRISMTDAFRFSPAAVTVKRGEVVRLVSVNNGKLKHEMVLGTMADLKKHAELMKQHPHMEHDEPHMAHVAPGESGEIVWQFTRAGEFYFGCLIPGHFDAGMIGKIIVKP
jgi:uncharacterized cupredoxin-like copper-binding protein